MRYVIAGAGPAGISAAKTLRQLDRDGEIVLVSKDDQVPFPLYASQIPGR